MVSVRISCAMQDEGRANEGALTSRFGPVVARCAVIGRAMRARHRRLRRESTANGRPEK